MTHDSSRGTRSAWAALGGDPALVSGVSTVVRDGALPARLPVLELARACVGVCALAAAELAARRTGRPVPPVRVDDGAVATAFISERHLLVDGRAPVNFAPLSRFWRTADGWVRTHANYPHHRARLAAALGLGEAEADVDRVAAMLAERPSRDIEETVYAAGGLAVALRSPEEWARHEQARAVAAAPLVVRSSPAGAAPRRLPAPSGGPLLPAAGLRVLDLTRVIAGPVATRTLALLGADVLRVDSPELPELDDQHADTGFGKRSAVLDLATRAGRRSFEELLAQADVVVSGYRPGALDRFGLSPDALAERRPGIVVGQLSAWGFDGPWAGRRGFDSLVQVATGIAATEGSAEAPGALPAQALDHGTGYLTAAAVLRAVTDQLDEGGTRVVRLALARTARWLTSGLADDTDAVQPANTPRRATATPAGGAAASGDGGGAAARVRGAAYAPQDCSPWLAVTDSPIGTLRHALPPVAFDGGPLDWTRPPGRWGSDAAVWERP
ncbi:CoA transferase [Streptomyces sp. NPDC002004]